MSKRYTVAKAASHIWMQVGTFIEEFENEKKTGSKNLWFSENEKNFQKNKIAKKIFFFIFFRIF